jgi:hypothetical protein
MSDAPEVAATMASAATVSHGSSRQVSIRVINANILMLSRRSRRFFSMKGGEECEPK